MVHRKFYGPYWDVIKQYEVSFSLSQMLHNIFFSMTIYSDIRYWSGNTVTRDLVIEMVLISDFNFNTKFREVSI